MSMKWKLHARPHTPSNYTLRAFTQSSPSNNGSHKSAAEEARVDVCVMGRGTLVLAPVIAMQVLHNASVWAAEQQEAVCNMFLAPRGDAQNLILLVSKRRRAADVSCRSVCARVAFFARRTLSAY